MKSIIHTVSVYYRCIYQVNFTFILSPYYLYIICISKFYSNWTIFSIKKTLHKIALKRIFFWLIAFTRSKLPVLQVNSIKCSDKLTQFQLIVDQVEYSRPSIRLRAFNINLNQLESTVVQSD